MARAARRAGSGHLQRDLRAAVVEATFDRARRNLE